MGANRELEHIGEMRAPQLGSRQTIYHFQLNFGYIYLAHHTLTGLAGIDEAQNLNSPHFFG